MSEWSKRGGEASERKREQRTSEQVDNEGRLRDSMKEKRKRRVTREERRKTRDKKRRKEV